MEPPVQRSAGGPNFSWNHLELIALTAHQACYAEVAAKRLSEDALMVESAPHLHREPRHGAEQPDAEELLLDELPPFGAALDRVDINCI